MRMHQLLLLLIDLLSNRSRLIQKERRHRLNRYLGSKGGEVVMCAICSVLLASVEYHEYVEDRVSHLFSEEVKFFVLSRK